MFKNKTLLISGGTGSFGNAVLDRFINSDIGEIRIFSRDEKKQDDMRRKYQNSKIKFHIGDVRDKDSINNAMKGVDFVFHAAALKQVPSCEFYPMEAVKTNIIGTSNVLDVAVENSIKKIICLSTDKAVYPINSMGVSKAMMEKVFVAKSRISGNTKVIGTRYGNVMASRGSVIPLFYNQLINNKPLTITNPDMTRFMMTLQNAVDLVLYAFENGESGDIFVQKAPSSSIGQLAEVMKKIFKSKSKVKSIGIRHGEKMHETLLSKEEKLVSEDLGNYFRIPADNRDLNYEKYFEKGLKSFSSEEFNSFNTERLSDKSLAELLASIGYK
ncbi:MAG: polysaccharide biosynthesis protein [Flavobacteriaceae bacterium]|jgi:UDP-N-acetylglucosamine 4,6-dehydratase/5-epimerase|nr:polysaccharide biosynthesis protein [Flavobacteriaceae bacterium]MBT7623864.1 polysaccharide biosynthesis protein [Flavobacteriaceae bacterium]